MRERESWANLRAAVHDRLLACFYPGFPFPFDQIGQQAARCLDTAERLTAPARWRKAQFTALGWAEGTRGGNGRGQEVTGRDGAAGWRCGEAKGRATTRGAPTGG